MGLYWGNKNKKPATNKVTSYQMEAMGVKDVLKKLKPQEQSCCSVEIEEKKEKNEKEQQDNNCCCNN